MRRGEKGLLTNLASYLESIATITFEWNGEWVTMPLTEYNQLVEDGVIEE